MLDQIKLLKNVANVNNYDEIHTFLISPGNTNTVVTIQLWQSDLKLRYMPESGSTAKINFLRHDSIAVDPVSQSVSKTMSNPFPQDKSIWQVTLSATETAKIIDGGFQVELTEPTTGKTKIWSDMTVRVKTGPYQAE